MSELYERLMFRGRRPGVSELLGTSAQVSWGNRFRELILSEECELLDLINVPAAVTFRQVPAGEQYCVIDQHTRCSIQFERVEQLGDVGAYHLYRSPDVCAPPLLANLFDVARRLPPAPYVVEWPVLGLQVLGDEMSWSGP